jgi:hypothetical protein
LQNLGEGQQMIDFDLVFAIAKALINPLLNDLVKQLAAKRVESIYKASLTGNGAIAQGENAVATGEGSVAIGGDIKDSNIIVGDNNSVVTGRDVISGDKVEKPSEKDIRTEETFQKIAETSRFITKQLEIGYSHAREQAYIWFRFSIIAAVIGALLIAGGVIALFFGKTTEGMITAICSLIPNAIAALFFVQSKASNERVDAIQNKLTEFREIQTAIEIANSIETKKERDKLKAEIIRKVISLSAAS